MSTRRRWAAPLVPVYRAAVAAEAWLYRSGVRRTRSLGWPVISVGSLSAGGAGKTPVVIALASMLRERGWEVDVLSRGYGRQSQAVERVIQPDCRTEEAALRFGDEPVLIAERTGAPVWVGNDRFRAGTAAEEAALANHGSAGRRKHREWRDREASGEGNTAVPPIAPDTEASRATVHLLDDGFQHRRLRRDFDLVLITREDLEDALLPAGNLREPLEALQRADAVVLREEEREDIEADVQRLTGGGIPLWSIRRTLRFPAPLGVFSAGLRPIAFCALARPENFASSLAEAGCGVVETVAFPDHHRYADPDIDRLLEVARSMEASGFVTTEKDAVKLSPEHRQRLGSIGALAMVSLDAEFIYKSPVLRMLEARLQRRQPVVSPRRQAAPTPPADAAEPQTREGQWP